MMLPLAHAGHWLPDLLIYGSPVVIGGPPILAGKRARQSSAACAAATRAIGTR